MLKSDRTARIEETERAAWAAIEAEADAREKKTARLRAARLANEQRSEWKPIKKPT